MTRGRKKHSIPTLLKALREKRRWSLEDVSEFTGIPKTTLHQYETGKSEVPPERLEILSRLYNVSVDFLVTGQDGPGQFAREHPEHFQLLNRAAKELPGDRFELLKEFMTYFVRNKGIVPGVDWDEIRRANEESLKSDK